MKRPGGLGRNVVYRGEGEFRVPTWPGYGANTVMLRKIVKGLKRAQRSVASSFGEGFGMYARKVVPRYISSIICESCFPFVREEELTRKSIRY